jgi:hypothetical protein
MFSSGRFPGILILYADVSEHSLFHLHTHPPMKMEQIISKRRHIKFRCRELHRRKHTTFRTWQKFEIKLGSVDNLAQNKAVINDKRKLLVKKDEEE